MSMKSIIKSTFEFAALRGVLLPKLISRKILVKDAERFLEGRGL